VWLLDGPTMAGPITSKAEIMGRASGRCFLGQRHHPRAPDKR
jgi:hypothetical protein